MLSAFDFGAAIGLATRAGRLGVAGLCAAYGFVYLMDCHRRALGDLDPKGERAAGTA